MREYYLETTTSHGLYYGVKIKIQDGVDVMIRYYFWYYRPQPVPVLFRFAEVSYAQVSCYLYYEFPNKIRKYKKYA